MRKITLYNKETKNKIFHFVSKFYDKFKIIVCFNSVLCGYVCIPFTFFSLFFFTFCETEVFFPLWKGLPDLKKKYFRLVFLLLVQKVFVLLLSYQKITAVFLYVPYSFCFDYMQINKYSLVDPEITKKIPADHGCLLFLFKL